MTSNSANIYFVTLTILPQKEGIDVPQLIHKISKLLTDNDPAIKFLHKIKVYGEAKLFLFVQVTDNCELERVMAGLHKLGPIDVESQPIICYENFAENIKVANDLCKKGESCLQKDGLYWLEFTVEYHGLKFDEFVACWKKEAETVLSLRCQGIAKLELFKSLAQRKVIALMNSPEASKLDNTIMTLPIMIDNGSNILLKTRAVHYLDEYNQRMAQLKL